VTFAVSRNSCKRAQKESFDCRKKLAIKDLTKDSYGARRSECCYRAVVDYSFTTMLVIVTCMVLTMAIVVPLIHRAIKRIAPAMNAPGVPQWTNPSRPSRCARCAHGELVAIRGVSMSAELPVRTPMLPSHRARQNVDLEILICSTCGRSEFFVGSPRAIAPFSSFPPQSTSSH
jgi:hypothetical protein